MDHWVSWLPFMEEAVEASKGSLTCPRPPQYQAEVQGFPLGCFMLTWSGPPIAHILHPLTPSLAPEGVSYLPNPIGEKTLPG